MQLLKSLIDPQENYGKAPLSKFFKKVSSEENKLVRILDIGAGSGRDLHLAASFFSKSELHAIECYPKNVETLKQSGVFTKSIDLERAVYPYENNTFDLIIANQILEHCKEIFWIFHEVTRILKPSGHLMIGVPNIASFHNRLLLLFGQQPTSLKNWSAHVRGFSKPDLENTIKKVAPETYTLENFGGSNFYPFPKLVARPLARIFPTLAWSIFFDFKKVGDSKDAFLRFPIEHRLETNFYLGPNQDSFTIKR